MAQAVDNRKVKSMTLADAKSLMKDIAILKAHINKEDAILKIKVNKLKTAIQSITLKTNEKIDPLRVDCDDKKAQLSLFIEFNPELFKKPKSCTTQFGSFGFKKKTDIDYDSYDEETLIEFLKKEKRFDLLDVVYKVKKAELKKALVKGDKFEGAKLIGGDIIDIKEDTKTLIGE